LAEKFDEFSKHLAKKQTRRGVLKFLGAGIVGAFVSTVFSREADADRTAPRFNSTLPEFNSTLPTVNSVLPRINNLLPEFNRTMPDFNGTLPDFNGLLNRPTPPRPRFNGTLPFKRGR
jgi:hypothetical protein